MSEHRKGWKLPKITLQSLLDVQNRWKKAGLLITLGLCVVAALPPIYILPLAFIGFSGLFLLLDRCTTAKQAFFTGWFFGVGFFGGGLYWLTNAFLVNAGKHGWLIPIAIPALAFAMGLFIGLTTLSAHFMWRNQKHPSQAFARIILFAVAWTLWEWVRSWIFTGFPWNLAGTVWAFSDVMMQPAAYVGAFGFSLLSVLALSLPACFYYLEGNKRVLPLLACLLIPILFGVTGSLRLQNANVTFYDDITLRLVQPNIDQAHKWDRNLKIANFNQHLELSLAENTNGKRPSHIIWPETAVTYALNREPNVLRAVASVVPPGGAVLTGTPRMTPRGQEPFQVWNSLLVVNEKAEITAVYDKSHLVPFGEYIPFRRFNPIPKLTAGMVDFSAGDGIQTLQIKGLPSFSPLICYEVIFPGSVVNEENRPHWLLNLTNDGWYADSPGPYQHLISARMRSIEEGLPLIRVANTGITVATDAYGRVLSHLNYGQRGFIDVPLAKRLEHPPFASSAANTILMGLIGFLFLIAQVSFAIYRKR